MKNNLVLISPDVALLQSVGKELSTIMGVKTMDLEEYTRYTLSRDDDTVLVKAGKDYYYEGYEKALYSLSDYEEVVVLADLKICMVDALVENIQQYMYVVLLNAPIKDLDSMITQYVSTKNKLYKMTKTKIKNNFRIFKNNADIVVKISERDIAHSIIEQMMEKYNG